MPGFLVTGTDTGVGKTAIACGLLLALREAGVRAAPFKPVESGHSGDRGDSDVWSADAAALHAASGLALRREEVVPYSFAEALAPLVAAERAGQQIDPARIRQALRALLGRHDAVVVEGAGGVTVPFAPGLDPARLAREEGLGAVVVARPGLGTLNHCVLTVGHLRLAGVEPLGIVVNRYPAEPQAVHATNLEWLPRLSGVPVLAVVPEAPGTDIDSGAWQPAARLAAASLAPFVARQAQAWRIAA